MNMKTLGILFIIVGVLMFAYKGLTYKTQEKVIDLGAIEVTQQKTKNFPFSPVLGAMSLVGGIILVGASGKQAV